MYVYGLPWFWWTSIFKNSDIFSTYTVKRRKCQKYTKYYSVSVRFSVSFVKFLGHYTGLVSDVEIPGNPKYRESQKAKKIWQTHNLSIYSWISRGILDKIWQLFFPFDLYAVQTLEHNGTKRNSKFWPYKIDFDLYAGRLTCEYIR